MNLSKNFTLEEMVKSNTAKRLGIDNTPNDTQISNLRSLCNDILQPIRQFYGKPIIVTSAFRCDALNKAISGSKTSQHCSGSAADIRSLSDTHEDNKELFDLIVAMIQNKQIVVGQLLDEYDLDWVHVSLPNGSKLNEIKQIK